jgi:AraC-like DNA-binding protein
VNVAEMVNGIPHAALRGAVLGYRGFDITHTTPIRRLEAPAGVMTMVIAFGDPHRVTGVADARRDGVYASMVAGMQTSAAIGQVLGRHVHGLQVTLTPLGAYRVFAVPMGELAHRITHLGDLLGPASGSLVDRLASCPSWGARFALLDKVLTARLLDGPQCSPEVAWAWEYLRRTGGGASVRDLLDETGWSRRHLERRFREQAGLTPKSLARVTRLHEALRLQETGMPWADVAAIAGYHDQPHFDHDFKAMMGRTPTQFRTDRATPSVVPLDRVPGRVTSAVIPA